LFSAISDLQSIFWTLLIKHLGDVKQIGQFIRSVIKILIHPVAVQISPALSYVILPDLYPVGIGIHIAEEAEALIMQVLVCLIIIRVFIPAADVRSEGKDQDVRGADDISHPLLPFIRILFYLLKTAAITDMAITVAGQFPAVILEGLHHRLGRLNLSFIVEG